MHLVPSQRAFFWAALAATLAAAPIPAEAGEGDAKAKAHQLFLEGVGALDKGDFAAGCAKLRESLDLFAVANTLFNVAKCDEHDGKLATALSHWERGRALVDAKDPRAPIAVRRILALEPLVPRLSIVIPQAQPPGTLLLDGVELDPEALAEPMRVDPGKHVLTVRIPGRQEGRHEVELAEKERTEVVATPGPKAVDAAPEAPKEGAAPSGLRTGGFVALGVGGAGLITGAITGGVLLASDSRTQTRTLVPVTAVALGVGAAGLATGIVMLVLSRQSGDGKKREAMVAPLLVNGGGGVGIAGSF
jgi:hypothetical protein